MTGNVTGNVTGTATTTIGGTPNITVGTVTGTDATFSGNLTVNGIPLSTLQLLLLIFGG